MYPGYLNAYKLKIKTLNVQKFMKKVCKTEKIELDLLIIIKLVQENQFKIAYEPKLHSR